MRRWSVTRELRGQERKWTNGEETRINRAVVEEKEERWNDELFLPRGGRKKLEGCSHDIRFTHTIEKSHCEDEKELGAV